MVPGRVSQPMLMRTRVPGGTARVCVAAAPVGAAAAGAFPPPVALPPLAPCAGELPPPAAPSYAPFLPVEERRKEVDGGQASEWVK